MPSKIVTSDKQGRVTLGSYAQYDKYRADVDDFGKITLTPVSETYSYAEIRQPLPVPVGARLTPGRPE